MTGQPFTALLTLVQDDDLKVASLAMEQFLNLGPQAEPIIAELQESNDPQVRQRMHQLSGILARRRARTTFLDDVEKERISLWEGVLALNRLYDPQCQSARVTEYVQTLAAKMGPEPPTAPRIAELMREEEFAVPDEDLLDVDLYLMERVIETKYGSPALLCCLAHQIGVEANWRSNIVLYEGKFCLIDRKFVLLDPTEGWHISMFRNEDKIHPCSRKDLWLGILSQLFLVALVEGQLRELYHFGDLLSALNHATTDEALPFPLGKGT